MNSNGVDGKAPALQVAGAMKALTILGAMIGLLTGIGFALAGRSPWPDAFWRGIASAFVGGLLLRWWGSLWLASWQQHLQARQQAEKASSADPKAV
ncbi:MAG: hypothetical protein RMN51_03465 [Verrucomicrobiota bacterium]|nr:hypothetical protein [Limisphaera sp.]MDW8381158.1 hypothetical protein [Verrucomicrobiota bacterium]